VLVFVPIGALVGLVIELMGGAPWFAVFSAAAALALVLGQRLTWALSLALTTAAMLCAYAVLLRASYLIPVSLEHQLSLMLLIIAAVAWAIVWRSRTPLKLPPWRAAVWLLPVVALVLTMVVAVSTTAGTRVSWAMHSDAVWNIMTARVVLGDHGLNPDYASAAPLTPSLIAAAMAAGRSSLDFSGLLQHDVTRAAELWLLLMLASCVLAGVIASSALVRLGPLSRGLCTLFVAAIPLTWFVAGNSVQFGFYNATIALVLLLCAWIAWMAGSASRLASLVTLVLSGVATLATWAPLAVVPLSLAVFVALGSGLQWFSGRRLLVVAVSVMGVASYALAVTLPDLLRDGGSLAADGGIFRLPPSHVALIVVAAVAATVLVGGLLRRWGALGGVVIVSASGGLVLGYLLVQRIGVANMWGYYPTKFGWLVCVLLIVIGATSLFAVLEKVRAKALVIALVVGTTVATVGLMAYPRPTNEALISAWPTLLPALGGDPEVLAQLFALSDPHQKHLVSSSADDRFINDWLLQQQATGPNDAIRAFAYTLVATDASQLCAVADVWGPGVIVHTPDAGLDARLQAACPAAGITAVAE